MSPSVWGWFTSNLVLCLDSTTAWELTLCFMLCKLRIFQLINTRKLIT